MAHGYRTLQHWNQWLAHQALGNSVLKEEQQILTKLVKRHLGKHALLIGVPHQYSLFQSMTIPCHTLLTPLAAHDGRTDCIESDFQELPILTGSIDLVLLPHTLEFIDNPRHLLSEACRIVKPEGHIVITGFNPYSLWGLKKTFSHQKSTPWAGNFIHSQTIKSWLQLADFALEKQMPALFRPPIQHKKLYDKLHFLEGVGQRCFPFFGGAYVLVARATVIPLTPIRLKWKQQLSNISISTSMTGHIARQSK